MTLQAAKCPGCGGDLQVPDDRVTVHCMYCGTAISVRHAIHAAAANTDNWMNLALAAAESSNNQEAYEFYTKVLEVEPENYKAWFGKAEAAGWTSTLVNFRLPEMLTGIRRGLELAPEDLRESLKEKGAQAIVKITMAYYQLARKHVNEYVLLNDVYVEYLERCKMMFLALEQAHQFCPTETVILENLIFVYKDNIRGISFTNLQGVREVRFLAPQYEASVRSSMNRYTEKMRQLNPQYQPEEVQRMKPSNCFIATATMRRNDHPVVLLLRDFRDNWLLKYPSGRKFIHYYYRYGPYPASLISRSKTCRRLSYVLIVRPLVRVAKALLEPHAPNK